MYVLVIMCDTAKCTVFILYDTAYRTDIHILCDVTYHSYPLFDYKLESECIYDVNLHPN